MTLNISLVSRWGIHQSSDFRLVDADRLRLVSDNSPKLLQLAYQDWVGNVTYCGIGRWRGSDTSDWLKAWLTHRFGDQRTFEDVVRIIQEEGTKWLRDIHHFTGRDYHHTFIVTSFVSSPLISLISNYERLDSPRVSPLFPDLQVSTASINRRRIVVTGIPSAVSSQDVDLLESFGRPSVDTDHVQRVFAEVNARSSKNPSAKDAISESCWVYSNLPDGSSRGRLFGSVEGKLMPIMLFHGMDLHDQIKLKPAPGKEIQMTGSTLVTSESLRQKSTVECQPRVAQRHDNTVAVASIVDVGGLGASTTRVEAVNTFEFGTGESYLSPSGPTHAFLWDGQSISDLGTLGGASSSGKDINDDGFIAGTSGLDTGDNHAFLWIPQEGFLDLGTLGGRHSHAVAINNRGAVVGASWTTPGERPANPRERAFIWDTRNGMRSLGSLAGSWSRAYDINDIDQIVGISPVKGLTRGFFCTLDSPMIDIGTLGGDSCHPTAINIHGQVVGMSENSKKSSQPFIWSAERGMTKLPVPNVVAVRDISDDGLIAGDCETDFGKRSFVYSEDLGFQLLPWYEYHRSEVRGIANGGLVCGQFVGIEMHCHGVIWRLFED